MKRAPYEAFEAERVGIFVCRIIIYVFSMGQLFVNQVRRPSDVNASRKWLKAA